MVDDSMPIATETDVALIAFASVVLGALYEADVVRPNEIDLMLEHQQKGMAEAKHPTAAIILGMIRRLANHPDQARQREVLRKLILARPAGEA